MPDGRGWVGTLGQVYHVLRTVGCDRDEDGKFIVAGDIFTFLGMGEEGTETIVGEDAVYFREGQRIPLAPMMNSTSYGVRNIIVIA